MRIARVSRRAFLGGLDLHGGLNRGDVSFFPLLEAEGDVRDIRRIVFDPDRAVKEIPSASLFEHDPLNDRVGLALLPDFDLRNREGLLRDRIVIERRESSGAQARRADHDVQRRSLALLQRAGGGL